MNFSLCNSFRIRHSVCPSLYAFPCISLGVCLSVYVPPCIFFLYVLLCMTLRASLWVYLSVMFFRVYSSVYLLRCDFFRECHSVCFSLYLFPFMSSNRGLKNNLKILIFYDASLVSNQNAKPERTLKLSTTKYARLYHARKSDSYMVLLK